MFFIPLLTISDHYRAFPATSNHIHSFQVIFIFFCYFWPFSATCGPFWPLPTNWCISDDHFLPLLTISEHFKAFRVTSNHIQSFLAIFSYFWPFLATCDPLRHLPSTSNHFWWPFLTTNDHFWPFKGPKSWGKTFGRWLLYTAYIVHLQKEVLASAKRSFSICKKKF